MKSATQFKKVFIHRDYVDMRKSINGLSQIVELTSMGNLMEPHLFVFSGKTRATIKILYFDRSGFCIWQKRLEQDKFPWPKKSLDVVVTISPEQLSWLLDGYDIFKLKPFEQLSYSRVS
jgi:transposase